MAAWLPLCLGGSITGTCIRLGHDDFVSALGLLALTVQPEAAAYTTPLTPTQFIYPEEEDVDSLPFS